MSIDQQSSAGYETWVHSGGVLGVGFDQDEAVPGGVGAFRQRLELAEKGLPELEHPEDQVGSDQRTGSGGGGIGEQDVFELVGAGRQDGGTLVDLGGVKEIKDGEALDGENFVHSLDTETALAVEEVGDMGLLESGLLGKSKASKFP